MKMGEDIQWYFFVRVFPSSSSSEIETSVLFSVFPFFPEIEDQDYRQVPPAWPFGGHLFAFLPIRLSHLQELKPDIHELFGLGTFAKGKGQR